MSIDQELIDSGKLYQKGGIRKIFLLFTVVLFSFITFIAVGIAAEKLFIARPKVVALNEKYKDANISQLIEYNVLLPQVLSSNEITCAGAQAPFVKILGKDGNTYYDSNLPPYEDPVVRYISSPCVDNYEHARQTIGSTAIGEEIVIAIIAYGIAIFLLYLLVKPSNSIKPPYGARFSANLMQMKPGIHQPLRGEAVLDAIGIRFGSSHLFEWDQVTYYDLTSVFGATALSIKMEDGSVYILICRDLEELKKIYELRKATLVMPETLNQAASMTSVIKDNRNDLTISALMNALRTNHVKTGRTYTSMADLQLHFVLKFIVLILPIATFSFVYGNAYHSWIMLVSVLLPIGLLLLGGVTYAQKRDKQSYRLMQSLGKTTE